MNDLYEAYRDYHQDGMISQELAEKLKNSFVVVRKEEGGLVHHITVPAPEYKKEKVYRKSKAIASAEQ